ncbi:NAD(P)/FAD-dependent oxidoreductase [Inquilinus sp. CA228]|uniref:NAD(P)/FAD-dependent oxidoreductase n=1 Tax=Inquilinus sp. CA228 TaxID=3455609 RepID=UPI003F8D7335
MEMQPVKRVLIVGGGYAGTMLARALDEVAEVRLIEPRDRFVHNVAAIRAVVEPALLDRLIIPYDRLLRRGSVIQGLAADISEGRVTLADGTTIEADIVVAATGSTYGRPFKPQSASGEIFAQDSRSAHETLRAVRSVAIVGGGAVGVELAGEIAAAYPGKPMTLLASSPNLLPGYSGRLSAALAEQLTARGVTLRLGARVEGLEAADRPFAGVLTAAGRTVEADLVFPAIGARPVVPPIAHAKLSPSGRLGLDPWLRPAGLRHVFALGDAAETGDPMTIVAITRQAPWLAKTLKAVMAGRAVESLAAYTAWRAPAILVPLGPKAGASILPVTRHGLAVGPCVTSTLKGRDLFVPRYRKTFGYGAATDAR